MSEIKTALKLVLPNKKYEQQYNAMLQEWIASGEKIPFPLKKEWPTYDDVVRVLNGYANGTIPSTIYIKHTTFFIVDENEKVLGIANLRHQLNESLYQEGGNISYAINPSERNKGYATQTLHLALKEARKIGIEKVLLNCETKNLASEKVILKNGAKFWKQYFANGKEIKGFWIG